MTPQRRREIEEEEALRAELRQHPRSTPVEKYGCKYPLMLVAFVLLAMIAIGIYCAVTGTALNW